MSDWTIISQCPFFEAQLLKGALEVEGFEVRVDRHDLGVVYGLDIGPMSTKLSVPADQVEAATALIAELRTDED